jgi:restriction system protein
MVRTGRNGEREAEALEHSLVIAGWPEMSDLTRYSTRKELHNAVRTAYPHRSPTVVSNWTGQLWRLARVMEVDDLVVIPLKTFPDHIAIGRITGGYRHRQDAAPDRRHVRPVEWIRKEIPRSAIQQDLLYSLGSLLTICQLRRNGAARRIQALADSGVDPGPTLDELSSNELSTPGDLIDRAVKADDGVTMTIRELLAAWGTGRRTSAAVTAISQDLAENGLTTVPPFTEGWIGSMIRLVKSGAEADDSTVETATEKLIDEPSETEASNDDVIDADLAPSKPFALQFGNLLRSASVVSVRPDDSIARAQTLMLAHDFSQLPVIDAAGFFRGAVSWESIAKTYLSHRPAHVVEQATVIAPTAQYDELVLPRIEEISTRGYVFVRSADGKAIVGIITSADLTNRFGEIARPFTMIEECERRLKRRVAGHIPPDIIAEATKNRHKTAAKLTFGAYALVLKEEKHFNLLKWPLDHAQFVRQIQDVADIRNKMMHFSPDPIPSEWGAIDGLVAMLHAVDPLP